jgi:alginate O-acetyltransferase complex protein AlgI
MNFNYPYVSKSITEFWRRWHISLSSWFRDYVYIPLGGSRVSKIKHIRNLLIVWFLTGLWHGAAWNFVAWGLYYGVILIIEKYLLSPVLDRLPDVVRHIYSIVLVVIGWVLFFSSSFGQAADYIRVMFGAGAHGFADRESMYLLTSNLILWLILIFGSTPLVHFRYEHMLRTKKWNTTIINSVVYAALFIVCIAYLVTETYNPFLYFRF